MKQVLQATILLAVFFTSCKKEECKQCYSEEVSSNGDTITLSLGKKCGSELESVDGKQYVVNAGTARSYCKK